jgi:hypothetical protein
MAERSHVTASEAARCIPGATAKDVSNLLYANPEFSEAEFPLVGGRRQIPTNRIKDIEKALRAAGKLRTPEASGV